MERLKKLMRLSADKAKLDIKNGLFKRYLVILHILNSNIKLIFQNPHFLWRLFP